MRRGLPLLFLLLLLPGVVGAAGAEQGVAGLTTHKGKMVSGAVVAAWRSLDEFGRRQPPVALSAPTGEEGQYRLPLPPGEYYLVAGSGPGWRKRLTPEPGDRYCFFGNNPVSVSAGRFTPVGFNLVEIAPEPSQGKGAGGIAGTLLFEGKPLEKAYIFAYRPDQSRFRGPGHAFAPAGKGGAFQLRLAPGTYYLVARKRQQGSLSGPLSHGDFVGFYPGNPVTLAAGERKTISLELVQRLDNFDGGDGVGEAGAPSRPELAMGYAGRVVDAAKRPKSGIRVLAYESGADGMGSPLFISEPTDAAGTFTLPIPRPGAFLLIARESTGGKAREGEWYGRLEGRGVSTAAMIAEVEIKVSPVPREGER